MPDELGSYELESYEPGDYDLAEEQGMSPQQRAMYGQVLPPVTEGDDSTSKLPFQFQLNTLFWITGFTAFGLMAVQWKNQTIFAGLLGLPALYSAYRVTFDYPEEWQLRVIYWGLILSYICACVAAWLRTA